jgi:prepilin-type N-terminal cleavage/methylation domain-containing protein
MMRGAPSRQPKGFTLLETLVAVSILAISMVAIYLALDATWASYSKGEGRVDVQQNARVAMDQIARQIRMAGYFPENFPPPPPPAAPPPVCPPTPLLALANPIHVATNNALAIYGDADGTCQSQTLPASNLFLFCLGQDVSDPIRPRYVLWRVRSTAPFTAASYTCPQANNPPANASILAEFPAKNGTTLSFTYYDGNGTLIPSPLDAQGLGAVPSFANTAGRGAVRRVVITLAAQRDVPGYDPQSYVLTSDVRLRNLN